MTIQRESALERQLIHESRVGSIIALILQLSMTAFSLLATKRREVLVRVETRKHQR
jgi:hypothetical protein